MYKREHWSWNYISPGLHFSLPYARGLQAANTCTNYHRKLSKLHTWLRTIPFWLSFHPHMCIVESLAILYKRLTNLDPLCHSAKWSRGLLYPLSYIERWIQHSYMYRRCHALFACLSKSFSIDRQSVLHSHIYLYATIILSAVKNEPGRRVNY